MGQIIVGLSNGDLVVVDPMLLIQGKDSIIKYEQ